MSNFTAERMYKIKEIAALLNINYITAYNLVKNNQIGYYRIGRSSYRISQSQLNTYLRTHKSPLSPGEAEIDNQYSSATG